MENVLQMICHERDARNWFDSLLTCIKREELEDLRTKKPDFSADRLDLNLLVRTLLLLPLVRLGLGTHDTTAPVAPVLLVLVEVALLDGGDDLVELVLVLATDLGDGERGGGL